MYDMTTVYRDGFMYVWNLSDAWADLEVAGRVDEQVGGFEVTVQHVGWVNVLEASQDLVEEVADVVVAQSLAFQQLVQIRLHQSLHDVAGHTHTSEGATTTGNTQVNTSG